MAENERGVWAATNSEMALYFGREVVSATPQETRQCAWIDDGQRCITRLSRRNDGGRDGYCWPHQEMLITDEVGVFEAAEVPLHDLPIRDQVAILALRFEAFTGHDIVSLIPDHKPRAVWDAIYAMTKAGSLRYVRPGKSGARPIPAVFACVREDA